MKAIRFHEFGPPEVLRYEDADKPTAGPGQVLIRVAAAGVNFADIGRRAGHFPLAPGQSFPIIPGLECAGIVEEVGEGVSDLSPGDRVMARAGSTYAQYAVANAAEAVRIPDSLGLVEAATVYVTYTTAWACVTTKGQVKAGDTILIQAAASGVGIAAVQIAKHVGATVIGTASSDEKLDFARSQGLDHGINYTRQDFVEEVKKLTNGEGVPVIIDGVGDDVFVRGLSALKRGGRTVVYGVASGKRTAEITLPDLWFRDLTITGAGGGMTSREELAGLMRLFNEGVLKPTVERTWPLAQAAEAHKHLAERRVQGKVALLVE